MFTLIKMLFALKEEQEAEIIAMDVYKDFIQHSDRHDTESIFNHMLMCEE